MIAELRLFDLLLRVVGELRSEWTMLLVVVAGLVAFVAWAGLDRQRSNRS